MAAPACVRSSWRSAVSEGDADRGVDFRHPRKGATRPYAWAEAACDSRRAQMRGRFVQGDGFGCADRVFSNHDPICARCQTKLLRCCDKSRRRDTRRPREELRTVVRAAVWARDETEVLARVHSSRATAAWRHARAPRNRGQMATQPHSERLRSAAVSTRCDAPPNRFAARRASRQRHGARGQLQDQTVAETLGLDQALKWLQRPERRSAEPRAPKRLSARGTTFAGHARKQRPHLLLNSSVTPPSELLAMIAS
ncbi:hypothetical protein ABIB06_000914 [Bradyrhizobium sp. LB8.2]